VVHPNGGPSFGGFRQKKNNTRTTMDRKSHLLLPLLAAAAASVVTFAGIGVAAITGHLSMNPVGTPPVAKVADDTPAPPPVVEPRPKASSGRSPAAAKPIEFRPGTRIATRKAKCDDCGVVDSIRAREVEGNGLMRPAFQRGSPEQARPPAGIGYAALNRTSESRVSVNFVVTVRMEDGTVRTIYENQRPPFRIGERVRLVNGAVIPMG